MITNAAEICIVKKEDTKRISGSEIRVYSKIPGTEYYMNESCLNIYLTVFGNIVYVCVYLLVHIFEYVCIVWMYAHYTYVCITYTNKMDACKNVEWLHKGGNLIGFCYTDFNSNYPTEGAGDFNYSHLLPFKSQLIYFMNLIKFGHVSLSAAVVLVCVHVSTRWPSLYLNSQRSIDLHHLNYN